MSTLHTTVYLRQLSLSKALMQRQLDGLSDDDLLLQPESRGNCTNWILGHIINSRNIAMQHMNDTFIWDNDTRQLYQGGSAPIINVDSPHLTRTELIEAYDKTYDQLMTSIEQLTDNELDKVVDGDETLADKLNFMIWHEAYHTGQFEYLRQLTGVDDAVP